MFFTKKSKSDSSQKDELTIMRDELRSYYNNKQIDAYSQIQDDFTKSAALSCLRKGTCFDDVNSRQARTDAERALQNTLRQLENLDKMSDGEIKQLYYEVFQRWHPLG